MLTTMVNVSHFGAGKKMYYTISMFQLIRIFMRRESRVFPRNNKVWAHGPMSMKFDGPFL